MIAGKKRGKIQAPKSVEEARIIHEEGRYTLFERNEAEKALPLLEMAMQGLSRFLKGQTEETLKAK